MAKRVQLIKEFSWGEVVAAGFPAVPKKGDIDMVTEEFYNSNGAIAIQGLYYRLQGYGQVAYYYKRFKELCSDEDLVAYREETKKLFPELFPKILEPCS